MAKVGRVGHLRPVVELHDREIVGFSAGSKTSLPRSRRPRGGCKHSPERLDQPRTHSNTSLRNWFARGRSCDGWRKPKTLADNADFVSLKRKSFCDFGARCPPAKTHGGQWRPTRPARWPAARLTILASAESVRPPEVERVALERLSLEEVRTTSTFRIQNSTFTIWPKTRGRVRRPHSLLSLPLAGVGSRTKPYTCRPS
jgi:hypothetical protein